MKTEPDAFSIDDLQRVGREGWDGVRNYMARNYMRDEMKRGDGVLFYHSSTQPPGVVGIAKVTKNGHPDPTQFDPRSKYFDATSPDDDPRWIQVEIGFVERFEDIISLEEIKHDKVLAGMLVAQRGQRLSVQPVEAEHFKRVLKKGRNPKRRKPQAVRDKLEKLAAKAERAAAKAKAKAKAKPKPKAKAKSKRSVSRTRKVTKSSGGKKRTTARAKTKTKTKKT